MVRDWVISGVFPVCVRRPSCDQMPWYLCFSYIVVPHALIATLVLCLAGTLLLVLPLYGNLVVGISTIQSGLQLLILVLSMSPLREGGVPFVGACPNVTGLILLLVWEPLCTPSQGGVIPP